MTYFAERLKKLRTDSGLSMQALANESNVCKAMICKIENNETQPTLDVAGRLAKALGKTLSEMLHAPQVNNFIHLTKNDQAVWEDAQHIVRRNISPVFEGLKVEWLHVELPAGLKSLKPIGSHNIVGGQKMVLVTKGTVGLIINQQKYLLKKGDSFYFESGLPHDFFNPTKEKVEYYIVIKHP